MIEEYCMYYYIYCDTSIFDTVFINMLSEKSENIDIVVDNAQNTFDLNKEKEHSKTYIDALKAYIKKVA